MPNLYQRNPTEETLVSGTPTSLGYGQDTELMKDFINHELVPIVTIDPNNSTTIQLFTNMIPMSNLSQAQALLQSPNSMPMANNEILKISSINTNADVNFIQTSDIDETQTLHQSQSIDNPLTTGVYTLPEETDLEIEELKEIV